jgi:hypothetical protein
MRSNLRRAALPCILLTLGLAALVYGAVCHRVPVWVEKQREISVPMLVPGAAGEPDAMKMQKMIEKYRVTREEPEWIIVRDAAVGGVERLANGRLKRTYSGKAPSLCPT